MAVVAAKDTQRQFACMRQEVVALGGEGGTEFGWSIVTVAILGIATPEGPRADETFDRRTGNQRKPGDAVGGQAHVFQHTWAA